MAQQMRVGRRVEKVVDGHDLQRIGVALPDGLQHLTPDAPESVDSYTYFSHGWLPSLRRPDSRRR